jgi:hypothetical protein
MLSPHSGQRSRAHQRQQAARSQDERTGQAAGAAGCSKQTCSRQHGAQGMQKGYCATNYTPTCQVYFTELEGGSERQVG